MRRASVQRSMSLARQSSRKLCRPITCDRCAFTLVEMLVTVGILLLLTAMTLAMVNVAINGDRIRSGARQIQSYLEGARDRAIFAKENRGVRFLLDPDDPTNVSSLVFIGPSDRRTGTLRIDPTGTIIEWLSGSPDWNALAARRLLVPGLRIRIADLPSAPATDGLWYTISDTSFDPATGALVTPNTLTLSSPHATLVGAPASDRTGLGYDLEIAATVLPNQEPVLLAKGVVIDLENSRLPGGWSYAGTYSPTMDVMFSPRGTVVGATASAGLIHFVLADIADTTRDLPCCPPRWRGLTDYSTGQWVVPRDPTVTGFFYQATTAGTTDASEPTWPTTPGDTVTDDGVVWECFDAAGMMDTREGDILIVTLFTRTGHISTNPVFVDPPGVDPFYYSETGDVAR